MPDVDYGAWGARAGINPPGGMVGPVLASTTNLVPTHPIHHISGTSAISTITLPWTGFIGKLTLIADGAWTTTTNGNIGTALTAVAAQALELTYDGALWYPHIMD